MKAKKQADSDPSRLTLLTEKFLEYCRHKGLSGRTVEQYQKSIAQFNRWCEARGIERADEVGRPVMEGYRRHVEHRLSQTSDKPLSVATRQDLLIAVRIFFKWLTRKRYLVYNPASEIVLPKLRKQLPDKVLSVPEVEKILSCANLDTPFGIRDRAIMEVFWSTGIRRRELSHLTLSDIDFGDGTVRVKKGKNQRGRLVPLGQRAGKWVKRYLKEARGKLAGEGSDSDDLFLGKDGRRLSSNQIAYRVRDCFRVAGFEKGGCHLFRHAMATHMLKAGADIRVIQEILGHAGIGTTQVYTHLDIEHLIKVHKKTHPARWHRNKETAKRKQK